MTYTSSSSPSPSPSPSSPPSSSPSPSSSSSSTQSLSSSPSSIQLCFQWLLLNIVFPTHARAHTHTLHMTRLASSDTRLLSMPPNMMALKAKMAPIRMTLLRLGLDILMYFWRRYRMLKTRKRKDNTIPRADNVVIVTNNPSDMASGMIFSVIESEGGLPSETKIVFKLPIVILVGVARYFLAQHSLLISTVPGYTWKLRICN